VLISGLSNVSFDAVFLLNGVDTTGTSNGGLFTFTVTPPT
jgi:hypothetical protein